MAVHNEEAIRAFEVFRAEIDEYNDRRERLLKASRDVTTASKRLIFHLHRYPHSSLIISPGSSRDESALKLLKEAHQKKDEIVHMMAEVAEREGFDAKPGTEGNPTASEIADGEIGRATRYERAMGSGLEEFIEAVSFLHFLEHARLITLEEIQGLFIREGKTLLPVPPPRYLLGLSDLTGELMRFATNAAGFGEAGDVVLLILNLIRDLQTTTLRADLDPFVPHVRDLKKKQVVTTQSLRKIEDVSYAIKVRTSEYGTNPAALQEMLRRSLASAGQQRQKFDREE